MKQKIIMEKYPVFELEVLSNETNYKSVDEIMEFLKIQIEAHPIAKLIAIFDHYAHTKMIEGGVIDEGILDAKNIIFCFGKELHVPEILSIRPRSIAVVKMQDRFIITLLETPNDVVNTTMQGWVKAIANIS
ncbi:MAG: hypothetical protein P8Y43_05830 [Sulfurovaceae bacterium]|jgi:hypothetical protein